MGRLVTLDQLNSELGWTWYFTEFDSNNRPTLPCSTFPVSLAINDKFIADPNAPNNELKNEIRKWVENQSTSTIILDRLKKDYYHYWSSSHEYGSNINWGYHIFYFGSDAEALMFKLRFCDYISEILPYDPERPPNYIQAAHKQLERAHAWMATSEKQYEEATKKKDRISINELFADYEEKLQEWDGETELNFVEDDKEVKRPDLQRRYSAIRQLRSAEKNLVNILDVHSTFVPKSRY
jgi:hypothetical protein